MTQPVRMVDIWRGPILESHHSGHAVICDDSGQIVEAWGDPDAVVLPRSSSKMLQAMPLITSGAADARGLSTRHLAISCASHHGAPIHTDLVGHWMSDLGLGDDDFRCGTQEPRNTADRDRLIRSGEPVCRIHNNCSGKHAGFLTLAQHLGAGPEYVDPTHPVQKACLEAFEEVTGLTSPGYGIDGCSAPNFATTMHGMARAMARFAAAPDGSAQRRLHEAMRLHPELVAGERGACTKLMRASGGKVALKTGAEGYFIAILPEQKLGISVKATDGATRAAECIITTLLVRLGALDAQHPDVRKHMAPVIRNHDGLETGFIRPADGFPG